MAKSRKKTLSQKVVGAATIGMPAPAKKVLASRIGALLIIVAIPVLIGSGIVSVKWENGRPKVSINRERAAAVKQEAAQRIEAFRENRNGDRPAAADYVPHLGAREERQSTFTADVQHDVDEFGQRVSDRFGAVKNDLVGDGDRQWNIGPVGVQPDNENKQAFQPFHGLRDKIDDMRR